MIECDREGIFRATITDYGLRNSDGGAVGVSLVAKLTELFSTSDEVWNPWEEFQMEAQGDIWIIKKDGNAIENNVRSLCQFAGWDGNLESLQAKTWVPAPCLVVIKSDEYKGKVRFRIEFVNDYNRTPGAVTNVDPDKAKELQNRFGGQLRAIAGNVKRNGAPTGSKPAVPPPAPNQPPPAPEPAKSGMTGSEIPF